MSDMAVTATQEVVKSGGVQDLLTTLNSVFLDIDEQLGSLRYRLSPILEPEGPNTVEAEGIRSVDAKAEVVHALENLLRKAGQLREDIALLEGRVAL